jgi:O-antigen/teichoic acid export membrane protein
MGQVEESLSRATSYSLVLAIPVLMGGSLLGDKLLYFFYGAEFADGYLTLVILLIVQVVNVFQYFFTMYLDALDMPKESFKVTAIGVVANIMLNFILIPVIGISGAAISTLITMTLNALLARHILSGLISVSLERHSLFAIMKASVLMVSFVGMYRILVPLSTLWVTLAAVVIGGIVYVVSILKMDKRMYDEFKDILVKVGL